MAVSSTSSIEIPYNQLDNPKALAKALLYRALLTLYRSGFTAEFNRKERPRPIRGNGNYHSALMLVFFLGSAAVALAFAPVLISSSNDKPTKILTTAQNVTQPAHAICSVIMSALCLYFIMKKNTWQSSGKVTFMKRQYRNSPSSGGFVCNATDHDQISDDQTKKQQAENEMSLLQMVVFGVGALLFLACRVIYVASFEDDTVNLNWVPIVDELTYMVSIVIQVIFLVKYNGAVLPNNSLFHYSVGLMVADKVWLWLTQTLNNIAVLSSEDDISLPISPVYPINYTSKVSKNDGNFTESTFQKVIEASLVFLQPFFLESLTIVMGALLHLWNFIGKDSNIPRVEGNGTSDNAERHPRERYYDYGYVIDSEERQEVTKHYSCNTAESLHGLLGSGANYLAERSSMNDKIKIGLFTVIAFIIAISLFMTVVILNQLGPFEHIADSLSDHTKYVLAYGIQMTAFLATIIACLVSTHKIYHRNTCLSTTTLTFSEYLLFVTAATNFIWFILRLIAAATFLNMSNSDDPHRGEAICNLCYALTCIVQVSAQTQMLLAAQSVHQMGQSNSTFTRVCLINIAAINISFWLIIGIFRESVINQHRSSITYQFMNKCFGEKTTKIMIFLLYPAMELYRFHTTVVAYQILT
ncbi:uncharacterized protein [Amphiura filiformis]|uniref:uncharacterized protein n=1 Tax=Amphiura filiformis TaxID=82378 RepID=UPI003B227F12